MLKSKSPNKRDKNISAVGNDFWSFYEKEIDGFDHREKFYLSGNFCKMCYSLKFLLIIYFINVIIIRYVVI